MVEDDIKDLNLPSRSGSKSLLRPCSVGESTVAAAMSARRGVDEKVAVEVKGAKGSRLSKHVSRVNVPRIEEPWWSVAVDVVSEEEEETAGSSSPVVVSSEMSTWGSDCCASDWGVRPWSVAASLFHNTCPHYTESSVQDTTSSYYMASHWTTNQLTMLPACIYFW